MMTDNLICEACGEKPRQLCTKCIAFFHDDEKFIGFPRGYNYLLCFECFLSYLTQYYGMTNRELTDYVKWHLEVADGK